MSTKTKFKINGQTVLIGGDYAKMTQFIMRAQILTRRILDAFGISIGKSEKAAEGTTALFLSPRLNARKNCDCRGNISNPWGHLAYFQPLPRRIINGVKEEQRYRFRLRKVVLEPRVREVKVVVEATKTEKHVVEKTNGVKTRSKADAIA